MEEKSINFSLNDHLLRLYSIRSLEYLSYIYIYYYYYFTQILKFYSQHIVWLANSIKI